LHRRLYAANAIKRRARNALIEVVQWPTIVLQAKPTGNTRDGPLAVIIYGPLSILA
jgi:hypothetical protein